PIDLPRWYDYDVSRHGQRHDLLVSLLAGSSCERLGVGDVADAGPPAGIQHDGRHHKRAGAGPAASFVDTGHLREAGPREHPLVPGQACRAPGGVAGMPHRGNQHDVTQALACVDPATPGAPGAAATGAVARAGAVAGRAAPIWPDAAAAAA